MSDAKLAEPDEDLLEFLGGIDEVNDDSREGGFADFLANTDLDKVAPRTPAPPSQTPVKDGQRE